MTERTVRIVLIVVGPLLILTDLLRTQSEVSLAAAKEDHQGIQAGDVVEEEIPSVKFDRITIQTAKQVLSQKVKDAEREQIIAEQREHLGHVVNATVKKQGRDFLILDLGNNAEAVLRRDQIIPHETFGRGDRIKVLLSEIRADGKGPQVRQFPVHPMLPVVRTMKIPTGCISEEVMIFSWLFDVLVKR